MPKCAYCKSDGTMTREHVIPSFMYAFQKLHSPIIGWNEPAQKAIEAEQKIKDVCAQCNNEKLGFLDASAKAMFEEAGLFVENYVKRDITFKIDYHLFARWMLKVSYNSARCQATHIPLFDGLEPYMLDGASPPDRTRIALFGQLLKGHRLNDSRGLVNPFVVRLCWLQFSESPGYSCRLNIFGPLATYIMFFDPGIPVGYVAARKRAFAKQIPNAVEIVPTTKQLYISQSSMSWFDAWEAQLRRQRGW